MHSYIGQETKVTACSCGECLVAMAASVPLLFKAVDSTRQCNTTGRLLKGKKVLQPLKFFVSEACSTLDFCTHCSLNVVKVILDWEGFSRRGS